MKNKFRGFGGFLLTTAMLISGIFAVNPIATYAGTTPVVNSSRTNFECSGTDSMGSYHDESHPYDWDTGSYADMEITFGNLSSSSSEAPWMLADDLVLPLTSDSSKYFTVSMLPSRISDATVFTTPTGVTIGAVIRGCSSTYSGNVADLYNETYGNYPLQASSFRNDNITLTVNTGLVDWNVPDGSIFSLTNVMVEPTSSNPDNSCDITLTFDIVDSSSGGTGNPTGDSVPVYLPVESTYTVALPAAIHLSQVSGLNYANAETDVVTVTGNIADNEYITVTPASTVQLTMTTRSTTHTDVNVTQTVKEWGNASSSTRHAMSETERLSLETTLPDGQAGKYEGNLQFTFAKVTGGGNPIVTGKTLTWASALASTTVRDSYGLPEIGYLGTDTYTVGTAYTGKEGYKRIITRNKETKEITGYYNPFEVGSITLADTDEVVLQMVAGIDSGVLAWASVETGAVDRQSSDESVLMESVLEPSSDCVLSAGRDSYHNDDGGGYTWRVAFSYV